MPDFNKIGLIPIKNEELPNAAERRQLGMQQQHERVQQKMDFIKWIANFLFPPSFGCFCK